MLSLMNFPAEILLTIAQYLGSTYLRTRVETILLFKAWYSVTQSVLWEDISFSIANFEGFVQAPRDVQSFISSRVKSLSISGSIHSSINSSSLHSVPDRSETWHMSKLRFAHQARDTQLCTALTTFSKILPGMSKLHSFHLRLLSDSTIYTETDNLWTGTIRSTITSLPKSITNLTIDKLGQTSRFTAGLQNSHAVCQLLFSKDKLPNLKHLRLRTSCICPTLFSPKRIQYQPHLETLVIALNSYSPQMDIVHEARCCTEPQRPSTRLYLDIGEAAGLAVRSYLPSIKTLRVVRWDLRAWKFVSFDVVSRKKVDMQEGAEWDNVTWNDIGNLNNFEELANEGLSENENGI